MRHLSKLGLKKESLRGHVAFGAVCIQSGCFYVNIRSQEDNVFEKISFRSDDREGEVIDFFKKLENTFDRRLYSIGIFAIDEITSLASRFWLELDVVPIMFNFFPEDVDADLLEEAVDYVSLEFDDFLVRKVGRSDDGRVGAANYLVGLEDYKNILPLDKIKRFSSFANYFKKNDISFMFISSTTRGGGVSLMRHSLMRLLALLGVNCSWHVIDGDESIFKITKKKFHNVLQGVDGFEGSFLKDSEKNKLKRWSKNNFEKLKASIAKCDVVIIDDYQPSGLIPLIKDNFPDKRVIYRSHIQIRGSSYNDGGGKASWDVLWEYLYERIRRADFFVSHPVEHFVPRDVDRKSVVYMPAATDPLDGLNKGMDLDSEKFYFDIFNDLLVNQGLEPLGFDDRYFVQVARFDPSKGIFDLLEAYRRFRERHDFKDNLKCPPKLVIMGNGAADDPEGDEIFSKVISLINSSSYKAYRDDIKVAVVPHIDQILNVMLRRAYAAFQLSYNEGFEIKVSESIWKGVPVVVYDGTGAELQVNDKVDGFILKNKNIGEVVDSMSLICENEEIRDKMSSNAKGRAFENYTTIDNAINWLSIIKKAYNRE